MKTTKTIFSCDCCKTEVKDEKDLISVRLPYQIAEDTTVSLVSWKMVDRYAVSKEFEICQACAKKIVEGYRKYMNIANYPYAGWEISLCEEKQEEKQNEYRR